MEAVQAQRYIQYGTCVMLSNSTDAYMVVSQESQPSLTWAVRPASLYLKHVQAEA